MAQKQEAKILAREMVKPSSPTPPLLSRFNLSLLDQLVDFNVLIPMIWFYSGTGRNMNFSQTCEELKSSLSRTLALFYPFSGRIRDDPSTIDCCDDGVEFVEAQLNCPMSNCCGSLYPDLLKPLVPVEVDPIMQLSRKMESLCVVQATLFECGGVAICVCLSHKIADAVTFLSFVKAWATIASDDSGQVECPDLGLASLLPPLPADRPQPQSINVDPSSIITSSRNLLTRRLFFSASKIEELKARACSPLVDRPTRVEAVTGLIWKCAAAAAKNSTVQPSVVCISADLRRKLAPLVSGNTVGNLLGMVIATCSTTTEDDEMNIILSKQVIALRKSMEKFNKRFEGMAGKANITASLLPELEANYGEAMRMDIFRISSLCGVPIYFDFGWGRAKLVTPIVFVKNMVMLMDMEDQQGVQALVTLQEQEMEVFEKDHHLLSFASLTHHDAQAVSAPKPKL